MKGIKELELKFARLETSENIGRHKAREYRLITIRNKKKETLESCLDTVC